MIEAAHQLEECRNVFFIFVYSVVKIIIYLIEPQLAWLSGKNYLNLTVQMSEIGVDISRRLQSQKLNSAKVFWDLAEYSFLV